jgi:hypothetical protein
MYKVASNKNPSTSYGEPISATIALVSAGAGIVSSLIGAKSKKQQGKTELVQTLIEQKAQQAQAQQVLLQMKQQDQIRKEKMNQVLIVSSIATVGFLGGLYILKGLRK